MIDYCKRLCRPLTRAEVLTTAASPRLSPAHGGSKETVGHNLPALVPFQLFRTNSCHPSGRDLWEETKTIQRRLKLERYSRA